MAKRESYSAIRAKAAKTHYGGPREIKPKAYATGGRIKPAGKTVINIITGGQGAQGAPAGGPPGGMPPAPPPPPPMNPMLAQAALSKMGAGTPPAAPGMPGAMARGGAAYATGGAVKAKAPMVKPPKVPAMNAGAKGFNTRRDQKGQFAQGGRIMTAGGASGIGRLQKMGLKP